MNYINFHFKELKFSIIYSFISISSLIIVVYDYIEIFLSYYISFTGTNIHFIFTDLMEVFFINIQFSILFACIFSFPSIMLLVLLYVKPGLYTYENNLINRLYFIYNFLVLPSIIY
jgi:Sec-independent protein secretion pathway component TatC